MYAVSANVDYVDTEGYFPFLNQLLQGLSDRFEKTQQQMTVASKLVTSYMVRLTPMTPAEQEVLKEAFPDMPSSRSFFI